MREEKEIRGYQFFFYIDDVTCKEMIKIQCPDKHIIGVEFIDDTDKQYEVVMKNVRKYNQILRERKLKRIMNG